MLLKALSGNTLSLLVLMEPSVLRILLTELDTLLCNFPIKFAVFILGTKKFGGVVQMHMLQELCSWLLYLGEYPF